MFDLQSVQLFANLIPMDEQSTPTTPAVLGERLVAARIAKGLKQEQLLVEFDRRNLPEQMRMSRSKLINLEKGVTAKPDAFDIEILATIYGVPVETLSPEIAEILDGYRNFVVIPGGADQGSPCTPDLEPQAA